METSISTGKATTVKTLFSRQTSISIDISSDESIVWTLLTNASDFSRWTSTILSIEGNIALGEKIRLKSYLDPKRVFKLTIKELDTESKLVWGDGMGNRTYTLKRLGNQLTRFTMTEKIGGPLFPLFSGMIPSFDASFEQFAQDLKKEAEIISSTK